jgi:hypothetical protein
MHTPQPFQLKTFAEYPQSISRLVGMAGHDVVSISSEEGTIDYPVVMQGSGGSAPVPSGGSAPVPKGGSAPGPSGGSAHAPNPKRRVTARGPSGGSAPVPSGGSAPVPKGGSPNYPSGSSGVYPTSTSSGSALVVVDPTGVFAPDLADPDAETQLDYLNLGGSAPAPAWPAPPPVPVQPDPPIFSEEVREFKEWLHGLLANVLDELPPDSPSYARARVHAEIQVETCWIRFLAEYRWLRKNPKAEPRFWANLTKMKAEELYKKLFKDIGKMALLPTRALAKKVGSDTAKPVAAKGLSGQVLDLTDHDSHSSVQSITEPEEPSSFAADVSE